MRVPVYAGLNWSARRHHLCDVDLDLDLVGDSSDWAGSYYVLEMGDHFHAYGGVTAFPDFPPIPDLPHGHPYTRLATKLRAAAVTGNIGEVIAAIVATECMELRLDQFMHIKPRQAFRKRKAPDYLMQLSDPKAIAFLQPAVQGASLKGPIWWPVESKSRITDRALVSARQDAFYQLAAYWHSIHAESPTEVGFGMVACYVYHPPRRIDLTVFSSTNQNSLLAHMSSISYHDYAKNLAVDGVTGSAFR